MYFSTSSATTALVAVLLATQAAVAAQGRNPREPKLVKACAQVSGRCIAPSGPIEGHEVIKRFDKNSPGYIPRDPLPAHLRPHTDKPRRAGKPKVYKACAQVSGRCYYSSGIVEAHAMVKRFDKHSPSWIQTDAPIVKRLDKDSTGRGRIPHGLRPHLGQPQIVKSKVKVCAQVSGRCYGPDKRSTDVAGDADAPLA
ncbi:hypothetical protein MAPG_11211 [Magnaporthiopsis poae ATCC 64411]|uniref:EF-hand domain-containing protein n=1 Tax=Magnaporthiopsis poae (strain ATCC 64411 / 73-15) TaxID=644358 RepID=A0A0C4EEN7_MAGP6|nr:hypothetical protein MAPG_11211 [Magnaporthiopsis poae ATCC 64411]